MNEDRPPEYLTTTAVRRLGFNRLDAERLFRVLPNIRLGQRRYIRRADLERHLDRLAADADTMGANKEARVRLNSHPGQAQ